MGPRNISGPVGPEQPERPNAASPVEGTGKVSKSENQGATSRPEFDKFVSSRETTEEVANTVTNTVEGYKGVIKKLFKLPAKATEFLAQKTFERFNREENT